MQFSLCAKISNMILYIGQNYRCNRLIDNDSFYCSELSVSQADLCFDQSKVSESCRKEASLKAYYNDLCFGTISRDTAQSV